MRNDLAAALAFAALGAVVLVWFVAKLIQSLRQERAAQPPGQRSRLWVLIAAGLGCYLFAYVAFGRHLDAPRLLALIALAIVSVPAVRRLLP